MTEQDEFEELATAFTTDPGRFVKVHTIRCTRCTGQRPALTTFYHDTLDGRTVFLSSGWQGRQGIGYCPETAADWDGPLLTICPRCKHAQLAWLDVRPRHTGG